VDSVLFLAKQLLFVLQLQYYEQDLKLGYLSLSQDESHEWVPELRAIREHQF
jgi:hypothetical protein